MSFFQEYQGFFVVGLIILVLALGVAARVWRNNMQNRMIDKVPSNGARNQAVATSEAFSDMHNSLATVVAFSSDVNTVSAALAGLRLPLLWEKVDGYSWHITGNRKEIIVGLVKLENGPDGFAKLELVFSPDLGGMPQEANTWKKVRKAAIKAAGARNIAAREVSVAPAQRLPAAPIANLSPEQIASLPHQWVRAQGI